MLWYKPPAAERRAVPVLFFRCKEKKRVSQRESHDRNRCGKFVSAQPEGQYVQLPVLHVEQNFFHGLRFDPVVGVDKGNIFAPGSCQTGIAGSRQSAVLLIDNADAGIAGGISGENFRAFVG